MGIGFTSKSRSSSSSSNGGEGWGMGFLLVFFPDEDAQNQRKNSNLKVNLSRTTSPQLLHRAQSIISICLIIVFITVLLFTVSTLPSSTANTARRLYSLPRRHLSAQKTDFEFDTRPANLPHALQGMGILYRRGTKSMSDLVVAHAAESLTPQELRLFLRLFFRSPLAARSDLILIFPARKSTFDDAILREKDHFLNILSQYAERMGNNSQFPTSFDAAPFLKSSKREKKGSGGEAIWGSKIKTRFNSSADVDGGADSPPRLSYGSVVGFEMEELDPENSLSGFMDHVPSSLRRWACYPMLLGRVRRSFKHMILVDLKDILVLDDPLGRLRSQKPESVVLTTVNQSKHGKRNSDGNGSTRTKPVHPGIIMGGSRGVRRLSAATLNDIVRAFMQQRKKRNAVSEMGIFNQLVANGFVLSNVNLITVTESEHELKPLVGGIMKSGYKNFAVVVRRANSKLDVSALVMKHICSFPVDSLVYGDC